jgi:hypothetical protein
MAGNVVLAGTLSYTPAGGGVTSPSLSVTTPYDAQVVGTIDIPDATAADTAIPIPFGSIGEAKALLVKNNNTLDIGIRLNGAVANSHRLTPGGTMLIQNPIVATAGPLTSASIVTSALQVDDGSVDFGVWGT